MRQWRQSLRGLVRCPGLTVAAILCLTLGIGSVTLVFTFVQAVLLRPLPYPQPERLVMVWNQFLAKDLSKAPSSGQEFEDHRSQQRQGQNRAFQALAGFLPWDYNLSDGTGEPLRAAGCRASAALFPLLGVEAAVGRTYSVEEETRQEPVVVLSHALWQQRFGGDEGIVGRSISLDDVPYQVIGVLPRDFLFPLVDAAVWVPFTPNPAIPRRVRGVRIVARLEGGVTLDQGQAQMALLADAFRRQHPDLYPVESGFGIRLVPLREEILGDVRPLLLALQGAVFLVLLIACANVANLLLVRAAGRSKEIALRTALGAGPGRLLSQLLGESLLLALPGAALGLLLAALGVRLLTALEVGDLPRVETVGIDGRVALFALAMALGTGILTALLPSLWALRTDLNTTLKEGGKTENTGSGRSRLLGGLVVLEIALAVAVLIATGLTLRSLGHMMASDPGFRTAGVLTLRLDLSSTKYRQPQDRGALYRRVRDRLRALPGVEGVGILSYLPPEDRLVGGVPEVQGQQQTPETAAGVVRYGMVGTDYFDTLEIPILEGRGFSDQDHAEAPPVVVVDRNLAARYWPDRDPLGQKLHLVGIERPGSWRTVVGVVGAVKAQGLAADVTEQLYVPYPQLPTNTFGVVLATRGDPQALAAAVRSALGEIDPGQPVAEVRSMEERLASSLAQPRFNTLLFALFGVVALALAAIGVYGVMAYSVAQRRQEIGLRMALGATSGGVSALILRRTVTLAAAGVVVGWVLAFVLTRIFAASLAGLAYGVGVTDWVTFVTVPLLLLALAAAAGWLPARRAAAVDPLVALRAE
jgi:putative ABC transport system permease protein